MATFKYFAALPDYQWIPDYFEPGNKDQITVRTALKLKWTNDNGTTVTLTGKGLTYDNGDATSGTINSIVVKDSGGHTLFTASGLAADFAKLFDLAFGFDRFNQNHQNPDGFNFLSVIERGNDTINGSSHSDDIVGGRNPGNDKIFGFGGDDFIKGDAGNDKIDGGAGYDTLSYQESFYDETAYKGVNINLKTGVALDCWGGKDMFKNMEQYVGSRFADTMTGDKNDNTFLGLRGNDKIVGGAGFDQAVYVNDERFGGQRGIIANLATGKIKDGFGNTDKVSGIEEIVATRYSDKLTGDKFDNDFQAAGGNDTVNGGGGFDTLNLTWWSDPTSGAIVDLRLATGQIVNDAFGGTDTIFNIEKISGSSLADSMIGNDSRNQLRGDSGDDTLDGQGGDDRILGDQGADTLTGGAGADEFHYQTRHGETPWGDTITDFVSGTDKITFNTPDISGMGTVKHFNNGTSAGGSGSWFYFNATDHTFYWDKDGTGSGSAVAVAKLTGVNALTISDFELFG
jgi:serralysin